MDGSGIIVTLLWLTLGPGMGYYVAQKRDGNIIIGVIVGALAGPCLAWLLVPVVMSFFDGGASAKPSPKQGAGRSFSVDENPDMGDKK